MAQEEWGYCEYNGPGTWSRCFPDAAGTRQSPIDIKQTNLKSLDANNRLSWKYVAENNREIQNCGYGWKVHVDGATSELTGGPLEDKYILEQFHCHWGATNDEGSEHTVNGRRYAGELHMVHWNVTKYSKFDEAAKHPDGLCVLGVFLTPGKRHHELDKVVHELSKIQFKGNTAEIPVPINPALFIPAKSGYYTYHGSLTTPPCSECVIWIVFKEPVQVSNEQLTTFRSLKSYYQEEICPSDEFEGFVKHNFRPTVPLGQREIREYRQ